MATYTETLRYLSQLELERDAAQMEDARNPTMDEYAEGCANTIKICLGHVQIAEKAMSRKDRDSAHQARIRKAQYRPIESKVQSLKNMGRQDLIPQAAYDFLATK